MAGGAWVVGHHHREATGSGIPPRTHDKPRGSALWVLHGTRISKAGRGRLGLVEVVQMGTGIVQQRGSRAENQHPGEGVAE